MKNPKLCVAKPAPLEESTPCVFSQAYQDSVKHHRAEPSPGSALDIYFAAEPVSKPSFDRETASASHLPGGVGLTCEPELTPDDTQRGQHKGSLSKLL